MAEPKGRFVIRAAWLTHARGLSTGDGFIGNPVMQTDTQTLTIEGQNLIVDRVPRGALSSHARHRLTVPLSVVVVEQVWVE